MNSLILEIAGKLTSAGVVWAYGGSLTLKRHGIDTRVNDIDIFVEPTDFDATVALLKTMGQPIKSQPHSRFVSQKYQKFIINGTEADLMAGFQIDTGEGIYIYPFDKSSITKKDVFAYGSVNFTGIEDWYVLYLLLAREEDKDKLTAIENYLKKNGVAHKHLLKRALKTAPARIKETVIRNLDPYI